MYAKILKWGVASEAAAIRARHMHEDHDLDKNSPAAVAAKERAAQLAARYAPLDQQKHDFKQGQVVQHPTSGRTGTVVSLNTNGFVNYKTPEGVIQSAHHKDLRHAQ